MLKQLGGEGVLLTVSGVSSGRITAGLLPSNRRGPVSATAHAGGASAQSGSPATEGLCKQAGHWKLRNGGSHGAWDSNESEASPENILLSAASTRKRVVCVCVCVQFKFCNIFGIFRNDPFSPRLSHLQKQCIS